MPRINSDRVSLFAVATGPRGSGKTTVLSGIVCERLLKAYLLKMLRGIDSSVWTNYPVGFNFYSPIEEKIVHLQSTPLNMEAFYTFDDDMCNGWVFIDELDQWADRQEWQENTQKITNKILTQIRKKKLTFMASVQDLNWINPRTQYQMDITIGCREAAFSPYGSRMGLDLGEMSFTTWRNISGVGAYYTYAETGVEFKKTFHNKRFWNTFDTTYQFDPNVTKAKYIIKRPTKTLKMDENGKVVAISEDSNGEYKSEKKDHDLVLLADIMQELKEAGKKEVDRYDLRRLAKSRGIEHNSQYFIEKHMANLGTEKDGSKFILA